MYGAFLPSPDVSYAKRERTITGSLPVVVFHNRLNPVDSLKVRIARKVDFLTLPGFVAHKSRLTYGQL